MILSCERCETRFRLDESRLPATGARVRCSRCKHAFFVRPPGTTPAEVIEELAEQAAVTGRPASPGPAWDLEEAAAGRTLQRAARAAAPADTASEFENESDWRFEDEVPQLGDSGASLDLPNGEASATPTAPDANENSFAELGDPESWDLLARSSDDITATRVPAAAPVEAPPVVSAAAQSAGAAETATRVPVLLEEADADVPRTLVLPADPLSSGIQIGGWIATTLLVAGVALLGLLPTAASVPTQLDTVSVGPLAVTALAPRLVDHALAGPIWVVSGELHNPGTEPRSLGTAVGVTLLDAEGTPIEGAVATAALPLPVATLREADLDQLREQADAAAVALAARPIAPGDHVAIEAVFASAPRGVVRFAVAPQPLPERPVPVVPSVEPPLQPVPQAVPLPLPQQPMGGEGTGAAAPDDPRAES